MVDAMRLAHSFITVFYQSITNKHAVCFSESIQLKYIGTVSMLVSESELCQRNRCYDCPLSSPVRDYVVLLIV